MQTQGTTGAMLIMATPPFALERARDVCVYTWTSIRPGRRRDRADPRTTPRSFDQSRTAAPATAGLGHVPSHVTIPGPTPGPGSHPGLTSHVSPFPSDHVTLTQIEYTQNIDTNTYPKNGYSDSLITCIWNGGVARGLCDKRTQ
jgi:hypothetical protein